MSKYFITQATTSYQPLNIPKVEEKYGAKFVGDFCIRTKSGGWSEEPIAIFYQPNPNVELGHKHYFGLVVRDESLFITDGTSAFSEPIVGLATSTGEVIFSRYRHDFVELNGVFIDGGRDYVRCGGDITGVERVRVVPDGACLVAVPFPINEDQLVTSPSKWADIPTTSKNEWTDGPSIIIDFADAYIDTPDARIVTDLYEASQVVLASPASATFKVYGTPEEVEELALRFPTRDIRRLV